MVLVLRRLEFELFYFEAAVQHFSHNTTGTLLELLAYSFFKYYLFVYYLYKKLNVLVCVNELKLSFLLSSVLLRYWYTNVNIGLWWVETFLNISSTIKHHHNPHVAPSARIFLTLSRHHSLSSIGSSRSSRLHSVSAQSWSSCLCSSMWRGLQEYVTYELVPISPVVSCVSGSSNLDSFRERW